MNSLLVMFLVSLSANILMFIPAYLYKTDKLTDISYAVTSIIVSFVAFLTNSVSLPATLLLLFIVLWAARLGYFLFTRIRQAGKDSRFDGMREHFGKFLRFWILQGASVFIVLVSSLRFWEQGNPNIYWLQFLGVVVFWAGLTLETVADLQKRQFAANKNNHDRWIDTGVWSVSRHPNYLGEILVWTGLFIYTVPAMDSVSSVLLAAISPLYITCLLLFVSGIPLLEKSADKKWGNDTRYQSYKKRVPVLIPYVIPRKRAS